ncbi:hypothetical protein N0V87_010496 [Didymella glomerata]|uniref:RING-type domain-containing protein n=1 Tax=Didymella glomerata TaxID=749621 RepID=A0A9W8WPN0_9PLEO|nr:hypothetical protein N0V87_010496 [Didymella glomerata]
MVRPAVRHVHEIVDLISDDEQDNPLEDYVDSFDVHSVEQPADFGADLDFLDLPELGNAEVDERDVIDLTAIPDVDVPPSDVTYHVVEDATPSNDSTSPLKRCEEAKKDNETTMRHVVEEAMPAAMIRKCNRCQQPFIKEYGCNKISCTSCGNKQCYICSKNVNNYEHFGDPDKGRCALHDNVEDVHEQAVKRAADETMARVKAGNPELSEADLMVQVSARVQQAEAARRGRAVERLNEFPYKMLADQLVHRPGFPRIPPLQGADAEPPR